MATVTITRELTPAEIENIAVTAYNGGINYWAEVHGQSDEIRATYPDDFVLFWVTERDGGGERRDVTPKVIADGISRVIEGVSGVAAGGVWAEDKWQFEPRLFADMEDLAAMDADEADWVVQLGLFGHLVFG